MIDPVTTRYAEALFNVARAHGALDAVQGDAERLAQALARPAQSARVFDARLSSAARRAEVQGLLPGASELFRDFVGLLFDKRREDVLRAIAPAFRRRLLQERKAAEGVVESARPLAAREIAELARILGQQLARQLQLSNRIVPELLGGVRVTVDNRMLDASVRSRLDGLEKRLREAQLPGHESS